MSRRTRVLVAIVGLAVLAGPEAAFGATELSRTGKTGPSTVRDTQSEPAAECLFDGDVPGAQGPDLDILIAVRTPKVRARDRSARRDGQWVDGRVFWERSVDVGGTGGYVPASSTKLRKTFAYDDQAVTWGERSWLVDIEEDYWFRISVLLRWYKPGSKTEVQGTRTIGYDQYRRVVLENIFVDGERCLPEDPDPPS